MEAPMNAALREIPTTVDVVPLDEFDRFSFDPAVPVVVRGAAARAQQNWTDEWLLAELGEGLCNVSLDARPAMRTFRRQVPLRGYMAALERSQSGDRPRGYLFHSE